jgi:RNA polymerase sigma-70 factor (ECF subfamily)
MDALSLTPTASLADHKLVLAARAHAPEALDSLIARHYPPIVRYLTRLSGDADLAGDLAQDTFLHAVSALGQLSDTSDFTPWLYSIARNRWYSLLRWRRLRRGVSLEWLAQHARADAGHAEQRGIEEQDERELVQQVFDGLGCASREALYLRHEAGCSAPQIAAILGISTYAAEKRLTRAERRFRELYQRMNSVDHVATGQANP